MQLPHLTTTSPDRASAHAEFIHALSQLHPTGSDIDELFIQSALHNHDKLECWGNIIAQNGQFKFDMEDICLRNSLLAQSAQCNSPCLVVSSVFADMLPESSSHTITQWPPDERCTTYEGNGATLGFMKVSSSKQMGDYQNRFDFMNIVPETHGKYIERAAIPYQSIDYRICAALSECGLLDDFSNKISTLVTKVGHDFVHATIRNDGIYDIDSVVVSTNLADRNNIPGEELWALQTHSAIFDELKQHGYAKQLAEETRALMDTVSRFEALSTAPDKASMAQSLRELLVYHVSNFVDKDVVAAAIKENASAVELEEMLLTKRPTNEPGNPILAADMDVIPQTGDVIEELRKTLTPHNIYELATQSCVAIYETSEAIPELIATLGELKSDIEARRKEQGVTVSGVTSDLGLSKNPPHK